MVKAEQGNLLKVSGISFPVIVVSNDYFNKSGKAIVCPVIKNAIPGPLHIELKNASIEGYVLCEQLKYIDLMSRRFTKLTDTKYYDVMNISDAVMGIFDYQVF